MDIFDKDYYVDSKISNYVDYREKKFMDLARDLLPFLIGKSVLDYGAATGGLMLELQNRHIYCEGTDISVWAVNYGKKHYNLGHLLHYYDPSLLMNNFDIVLFLDVLEHVPQDELGLIFNSVISDILIIRIPVSAKEGEDFVLDVSKNDKTHIQIHSKQWWLDFFSVYGYNIFTPLDKVSIYDSEGVLAGILQRT